MPKISELPDSESLTGDEWIAVVQDGVTKKTQISGFLSSTGSEERSLINPRWIQENGNFIEGGSTAFEANWFHEKSTVLGKVNVKKRDSDTLLWWWDIEEIPLDAPSVYSDNSYMYHMEGNYMATLSDDGPNHDGTATFSIDGQPTGVILSNIGDRYKFNVLMDNEEHGMDIYITNGASVSVVKLSDEGIKDDDFPSISWFGDQIQVHCLKRPSTGVFVNASAVLLDESGAFLIASDDITLSIT